MKKYIELQIEEINSQQQEELIALLNDFNALGFEQHENQMVVYFDQADFSHKEITSLLQPFTYQQNEIADQNWNALWESNFQPVVIDDFCAVRAEFHQQIQTTLHEIIITPKMSFGTGHHATTYMMIEQMKDIDFENKTVFDFGTGTGILAILAKKLRAAAVSAIDVDDWSIENAKENFTRNGVEGIELKRSSQVPSTAFEIVLANINKNVLLDSMPALANATVSNGFLLMSGLLIEDEKDIVEAANTNSLQLVKQTSRNNWICLLFVK